jgi:5'-nucleotidase
LSQIWSYQTPVHWDTARHYTAQILPQLLGLEWTQGSFVNVNFPHCPLDQVSGVRVTTQGMRPPGSFRPIPRIDERHVPYYWIKIAFPDGGAAEGNDLAAARDNAVSITPMQLDMTAHDQLANFRSLFETEPVGA